MSTYSEYLKTQQNEPLLLQAARTGDLGTIAREILAGADINEKNHRGYSALMLAAYNDQYDAALLLVEAGADANSVDRGGNSVLMGAAFKGHTGILNLLLKNGARTDLQNFAHQTALDFAKTFGRKEIIPLLEEHARPLNLFERIQHLASFAFKQLSYRLKQS
ncbi:ankyrin repeat domain-containing protein [Bdellovibrio svalbardensis]|uniref:Ankyrin repeat domain-containing protein n=1 Tax=Bdellovibrio svalbardensis TaxID=2972972 RepID=A0ABT6DDX2_9BACT|nr:ankyrin repeat domain-containing protein [Bdellovibrio svalbardensis]MDG0815018.1 ankyrin repeat domain-containing protein [Bdellovibrio svalbardensis]